MSLFQCENCGCCENTALSFQGFRPIKEEFDWSYAPEREGMLLCSACGPTHLCDGDPTPCGGKWHGQFPRVFLPKGMFKTASNGNLEHIWTGDQDYTKYALENEE
ncbi:hypothetical protein EDF73_113152 [Raoultella sp. BIGb0138]|uniref:hypothetical protein n=1 Tax=Raoultella sp. BIGb0138 TaxID=2485115 RepID=UPI0010510BF1|nr:hypothetical protein [Raoultella sp. BIGb0138]TCW07090.1 hypothetical protein EDF73_113152 [Raoultella sp. BIGb0138]